MRAAAAIICLISFSAVLVAQDTTQAPRTTQTAAPAQGGTIHGVVRSGNSPLPGATVTATNTLTGDKATTYTDIDGSFALQVPANGRYVVRSEMPAFAASTQEALINATNHDANVTLEPILASRAAQAVEAQKKQTAAIGKGFQTLSILQSAAAAEPGSSDVVPSGMPVPGFANGATESVSLSGNNASPFSSMSSDEMRARFSESRDQGGGGLGGFGGGGFGGGGRGGPPRGMFGKGFNFNVPHGSLYYSIGDAALNASPYALSGRQNSKAGYEQNRFGVTLGGPFMIPKLYQGSDKTFFFFNYNGSRGQNPFDQFSTVPTVLERMGDFSQTTYTSGADAGQPVELFGNGTAGNKVTQISPIATGLLNYIPLPNLPGSVQNFHYVTSATNNSDDFNIRLIHALGGTSAGPQARGPRNSINFGFHYHGSSSDITNPFPSVGGKTADRDFDIPVGYVRTFGKLTNNFRIDFNRSRSQTANLYQSKDNIAGDLGITGVSQNPFDWGLPSLSFTNFASLQDTTPELQRDQTWSFSDGVVWNHKKHTWRWGGDFRRLQVNSEISTNARGSFTFSGCATQEAAAGATEAPCVSGDGITGTGYDFADFLLGQAQQTSVQYGINGANYHFRGNSWDLYVQDEYKLRGNLTLNLGVRYEYVSPYSEINNRISNLDISPVSLYDPNAGLAAVLVQPNMTGPYHGQFSNSLMRPDRNNFAPRLGIAWKPFSKTAVRAGYGINYNTTQYQSIVQELAFQPPFAVSQTNSQSTSGPLTLQNGFPGSPTTPITNSYAVNPNYRLGYVQIRNLDIQQEILPTLIVNLDYTGTKGTDLDILEDPNRALPPYPAVPITNAQAFNYENSVGNLSANAGSVRVRKRLQAGVSIGGTYTFSKSIDDASTIGAGAGASTSAGLGAGGTGPGGGGGGSSSSASTGSTQVAQNPFNLSGERGLSSFNQTHKWTADYLLELPFGHDKRFLSTNTPWRAIFGDWQWSGDWTIASGLPFTPHILGSFNEVNSATNGTLRPDLTGEPITLSNGSINEWFNTAAFSTPPSNSYGNARRNSIIGPGTRVFDMAWTKLFPLRESRVLEFRAQATNVFNTPQYDSIDTSYTSPTFGRVISVGAMRAITMSARFRF